PDFCHTQSTVRIFPITKLEGEPLDVVNDHVKHFLVPFSDDGSQIQIKTTPPWPTSRITPSYVFGYPMDVPITAILHLHTIGKQTFDVDPDELEKLQRVADVKLTTYKAIPESEMQRYNASWAENLNRWCIRRDLDGLTGPASAPPEPPSAARPIGAMLLQRARGVSVVDRSLFPYLRTISELRTTAGHRSPSSPSLELGIDQEGSNQWPALPALQSADPAASGQKAESDPGVQSGSAWTHPPMRPREEETAGLSASSQTVTIPPETVRYEEQVVEATEEEPFTVVPRKKKRQSLGTGGAK
ncbi:hypothetical protein EXIGLDRAFT_704401, partial [Exidia glandulosa HHB12029]